MTIQTPINQVTSTPLPPYLINGADSDSPSPDTIERNHLAIALVNRDQLTRALYVGKNAVERRNTTPILSNVMLVCDRRDQLKIVTTNLDFEIIVTLDASIDRNFSATVACHQLHELLAKSRKSELVQFKIINEDDDTYLEIETDETNFHLNTLPSEEFPRFEVKQFKNQFTIDGNTLWSMLDNVKGAISTEETRYYLNGVYFHEFDGKLTSVATDGHKLYHQEIALPDGAAGMPDVIIPRNIITKFLALTKTTKNRPDDVKISMSETRIDFEFDNIKMVSKLIDGTFPDYHRVIPCDPEFHAQFNADDMVGAIKDVSLISSERGRAVKLAIKGDIMDLSVRNPDAGSATASITGKPGSCDLEIGYNAQYLIDVLGVISGDDVKFQITDAGSPSIITGNIEGWKAVLMPMRV